MARAGRILIPTDFTNTSERALDWATELATELSSSIVIMHAYDIPVLGFPDGAVIATPEIAARITESARVLLERTVERRRGLGVLVEGVLREGVPWEQINALADAMNVDMIVIGTHGRRGLARALLGSVAENVIRTAHRPVVVIQGPRE
jgi:nucleotide-binding universal stress UspA family protein